MMGTMRGHDMKRPSTTEFREREHGLGWNRQRSGTPFERDSSTP